jgi:eukaryotic-like serine/threonine-protein kinase
MPPVDSIPVDSGSEHPSVESLHAFAVGKLAEETWVEVERHLTVCADCNKLLESSPDDSFIALLHEGDSLAPSGSSSAVAPSQIVLRFVPGYQLLEVLGEGGMAVVWKARQLGLDRLVALKRIRSASSASSETLSRFRREAEAVARLRHVNIVQIYDVGEQDGEPYLALEYVAGGSLADKLASGPLPPAQAAALVETLARAMHHAHEHGILHRDLKPSNVMLSEEGSLKITDFGLAKQVDGNATETQSGALLGTPSYMAPEQTGGDRTAVGPLADVYALGAILYETLTGRPPFRGPSPLETLAQVRDSDPVPPRALQPTTPRDLQTICLKCLEKEPRRRYATAAELADDLDRFAAGEPIRARPTGRLERSLKWLRRKPYQGVLAAVAVLLPLAVIGGLMWHNQELHNEIVQRQIAQKQTETTELRERDNYAKSRHTILSMLDRLYQWESTGAAGRKDLDDYWVQDALAYVQHVLDSEVQPDPQVQSDAANLLLRIGRLQGYHGRAGEAHESFTKAMRLYDSLLKAHPEVLSYRGEMCQCFRCLAGVSSSDSAALIWGDQAVRMAEEVRRLDPADDLYPPSNLAVCLNDQAARLLEIPSRRSEAERHLQESIRLMTVVVSRHPERFGCKEGLAESHCNLGLVLYQLDRLREAEVEFQQADALLDPLTRDHPSNLSITISRASVALNWGNAFLAREQNDKALSSYDRGLQWSEDALRREPTFAPARVIVLKLHGSKATVYDALQQFAKAADEWDRVIELAEGGERRHYRLRSVVARARAGDSARAAAAADALAAEKDCPPDMLYNLACVYTLAKQADKAVALLSKLHDSGYFDKAENLNTLRTDTDLDPLRQRDDFLKLRK